MADAADNCTFAANLEQIDTDADGIGDACEPARTAVLSLSPNAISLSQSLTVSAVVFSTITFEVSAPVSTVTLGRAMAGRR